MNKRQLVQFLFCSANAAFCIQLANAQPAGLLYDPEPPADSAYVRVIAVSAESAIDITVDAKPKITKLNSGDVSEYMVVPAGKRVIALHATSKSAPSAPSAPLVSHTIDIVPGKALTVAFLSTKAGSTPTVFEDKANTNKLKSLVAAYHLDGKAGPLNLTTLDGNTKVFTNLGFGSSQSIQVNPISVELVAAKNGEAASAVASSHAKLSMAAGANYSVFLLPNEKGNEKGSVIARAVQNKTERYIGK
jgi:alginate O-acetyltransferase complex protein AlgF